MAIGLLAEQPPQGASEIAKVIGPLPGFGEVAEGAVERAASGFVVTPSQRYTPVRHSSIGNGQVELLLAQAEQDPSVRPHVAEQVDLVAPEPARTQFGGRRVIAVDVDDERLRPRVSIESSTQQSLISRPAITCVARRMHGQNGEVRRSARMTQCSLAVPQKKVSLLW